VDIGFSKQLPRRQGQEKTNWLRHIHDMWVQLEVFNLLDINNTVDYQLGAGREREPVRDPGVPYAATGDLKLCLVLRECDRWCW
jgi:hypothetical protein